MEVPLVLDTHHVSIPPDLEQLIRHKAEGLGRFYQPIIRCRVAVEEAGRHHRAGNPYSVRVDLTVPGADLTVDRKENETLLLAIQAAFDAATRQLQDYSRVQRRAIKLHVPRPLGRVAELCPEEGYGFLVTEDGREIYFHENSVLDPGFDHLGIGTEVRFVEELGGEGPQASTVEMVGT